MGKGFSAFCFFQVFGVFVVVVVVVVDVEVDVGVVFVNR